MHRWSSGGKAQAVDVQSLSLHSKRNQLHIRPIAGGHGGIKAGASKPVFTSHATGLCRPTPTSGWTCTEEASVRGRGGFLHDARGGNIKTGTFAAN